LSWRACILNRRIAIIIVVFHERHMILVITTVSTKISSLSVDVFLFHMNTHSIAGRLGTSGAFGRLLRMFLNI
jgi:hypothetical protein